MVDFPRPVDPFEREKIRVDAIKPATEKEKNKKPIIPKGVSRKYFVYLAFMKVVSDLLSSVNNKLSGSIANSAVHKELNMLRQSLVSLSEKNLCQDSEFLNFFAFLWLKLLKDYENYLSKNEKSNNLILELIDEINSYPQNAQYSLGFYISEIAGYKWMPFPYMEMLQKLYMEHSKTPSSSHLTKWIDILDRLLDII